MSQLHEQEHQCGIIIVPPIAFRTFAQRDHFSTAKMLSTTAASFTRASRSVLKSRSYHSTQLLLEKLNVEGLASKVDLKNQNVLMRVDLNVPLSKEVRDVRREKR